MQKIRLFCQKTLQKCRRLRHYILYNESGVGVIEIVLILVVLIALVLIFRDSIKNLLETILDQIDSSAQSVWA